MSGVIVPGGFEKLFYFLATKNVSYATESPFTPSNASDGVGGPDPSTVLYLNSDPSMFMPNLILNPGATSSTDPLRQAHPGMMGQKPYPRSLGSHILSLRIGVLSTLLENMERGRSFSLSSPRPLANMISHRDL